MGLDVEKTLCGLNEFFGGGCQIDAVGWNAEPALRHDNISELPNQGGFCLNKIKEKGLSRGGVQRGGCDHALPGGRGARFYRDGGFSDFTDPLFV